MVGSLLPRLVLVDPNESLCMAWRDTFGDLEGVEVVRGRFEDLPAFDCMVSPANSFGLMDGGVDAAITACFGVDLMKRVQARIIADCWGEQPVGTCMMVPTLHPGHPWLAHAPTMRAPMDIRGTDNVYQAMLAVFQAVLTANGAGAGIRVLACPGLGTGYGKMPHGEAARQMRVAFDSVQVRPASLDWNFAATRQKQVAVFPAQSVRGTLDVALEDWKPWDEAAYDLARSLGIAAGRSFQSFKPVVWNDESEMRATLLAVLVGQVEGGVLESRQAHEQEFRWNKRVKE
jgi:O-acetyl-ADP-ribose deacetylase (regulator of RNase III)